MTPGSGKCIARLAIVTTHPIQYYAPWFRYITTERKLELKVFYLWNPKATTLHDPGFDQKIEWDLPLLDGYDFEFVPNVSRNPGSARFSGIDNPALAERLNKFAPDAALLVGSRYKSLLKLIFSGQRKFPLLFRGDSHRLTPEDRGQRMDNSRSESEHRGQRAEVSSPLSLLRKWVISKIYSRFDAFLYVGQANREYFRYHGVPEEKLFFAPHAVENQRFFLTQELTNQGKAWRKEFDIPDDS